MGLNSINTNVAAYYAQQNIGKASSKASSSIARLSSGNRIVRASDDVAAMSTGTSLRTNVTTLRMALINTSQGSSMLQVADGALGQITDILQRQKSIAVQAGAGSLSSQERSFLNQEFQNLTQEIDRLASQTNFNGVTLLDGSLFDITNLNSKDTAAEKAIGTVTFAQNVVNGTAVDIVLNGQAVTIGSAAQVTAGTADVERGSSLQGTLDNLVNFLNSSTNTALSSATYERQGNSLVINQRSGGTLGQSYTVDNSIQRSTAFSSNGLTTGGRIGSVAGDATIVRYEQLLGFTAATAATAGAVTTAGGAGVIQAGAAGITLNNLAGGTTTIALADQDTLNDIVDAVNAVSATTGTTARVIGGAAGFGIQFENSQLTDIGLDALELAPGNLLETGTTGKLQLRSAAFDSADIDTTDLAATNVFTAAAVDINGFGGTTVSGTNLVSFLRAIITDYQTSEIGAAAESNLGLSATVEWIDNDRYQVVLSSDTVDVIDVVAGGGVLLADDINIDANTASEIRTLSGGNNDGLRTGATVATGTIGDTILNTLDNDRASVTMSFADITAANLATNLHREFIAFTVGNNEAINAGSESAGAMVSFQFLDATTAGATATSFGETVVEIGATLEETLDNLVGTINNYFNNSETDAYTIKQIEARREGRNVILEYTGVGDINNHSGATNAVAVYTNVAQTDMALSGASTDVGGGLGDVTVQYSSFNTGTNTGIDASNVINKDFVGKISGFEAEFSGTNNRVNLSLTVGDVTYTANSVNTSVTANTTVRLLSEDGGFLDIQFAANQGTTVDSQEKANIFAARIEQAFSTVNFNQNRVVSSYNAAGDIITNSTVTGSLTGTSFELQLSDFSDVTIDDVSVTAPPEGASNGIIEFNVSGETYRGISNIGTELAANSVYRFTSLTNPNNVLEFRTGSTAIEFDTSEKAANFETALKAAFGIGAEGSGQSLKFQVGVTTTDTLSVRLDSVTTNKLFGGVTLDVLTADTAAAAADAIDAAIDIVTSVRADVGALQSRFDFAAANVESSIQNQDAARGVLLDTDIAAESSEFAQAQVKLQAGISVLAQANLLPQNLLKLIG